MKILQICSARYIGGGERYLADLSNSLARGGHQVFVALPPDSPLLRELSEIPIENILIVRMRNALDVLSARRLARFVKENGIELIHAHIARDYPLAALAAQISGAPLVLTRHVLFPLNRLHKFTLRNVRGVIAPSNAVADALRRQQVFHASKIVTIRHGLATERFTVRPTESQDFPRIGIIGNLDPVKGQDIFVRAASMVAARNPSVRFLIIGDDRSKNSANRRAIERLISELNLSDVVELKDWTKNLSEIYSRLDILVSASRSESFGFAIVEAMLSGVPVIASATEGAKEIITSDSVGVIVPIDDAPTLAGEILNLITDEKRRRLIADAARRHAFDNFSLEKMVAQTEDFYRRILENAA